MQHLPHTKVPFWMQRRVSTHNFQRFISRNLSKSTMTAHFWKFFWTNRSKLGITSRDSSSVKPCFLILPPKYYPVEISCQGTSSIFSPKWNTFPIWRYCFRCKSEWGKSNFQSFIKKNRSKLTMTARGPLWRCSGNFWSWDLIHFLPKMEHLPHTKVLFSMQKRVRKIQAYIELKDVRKTVKQTCLQWEKVDREPSSLKTTLKSTYWCCKFQKTTFFKSNKTRNIRCKQ